VNGIAIVPRRSIAITPMLPPIPAIRWRTRSVAYVTDRAASSTRPDISLVATVRSTYSYDPQKV